MTLSSHNSVHSPSETASNDVMYAVPTPLTSTSTRPRACVAASIRSPGAELAGEEIDIVYTSDLARARETAAIIAAHLGDLDVVALRELREMDVGEWQGLSWPEIEEHYPEGARKWHEHGHGWESGETYDEL